MHPAIESVLQYFNSDHLAPDLRAVVKPFRELAEEVATRSPDNPETTVALRKLLEAKDAAVRSVLPARPRYPNTGRDSKAPTAKADHGTQPGAEKVDEETPAEAARRGAKGLYNPED